MSPVAPPAPTGRASTEPASVELQREQLRLHVENVPSFILGSAVPAALLAAVLWEHHPAWAVFAWLGFIAVALLARLGARWSVRRHPPVDDTRMLGWLHRFRIMSWCHALAWGLAGPWLFPLQNQPVQLFLTFVLAGMTAGAMVLSSFDQRTVLPFATAVLAPLALRLALDGSKLNLSAALLLVLLWVMIFLAGRRGQSRTVELVAQREAAMARADKARHHEALLKTIFDNASEGICVFDADLRLAAANDLWHEFSCLTREQLPIGSSLRDALRLRAVAGAFGAVDPDAEADRRLAAMRARKQVVDLFRSPNGRTIEMHRNPVPGGGFVSVSIDVTRRLAVETALAEKRKMLSLLLDHTRLGFWFIDNDLNTTDVNPAMCQLLGSTHEALIGRNIHEFIDADGARIFDEQTAQRDQLHATAYEVSLLRADGSTVHCYNSATPVVDETGQKLGSVGMFNDISEQKRVESLLRQTSELLAQKTQQLEVTMDSISQGILSLDAQRRITAFNRRLPEMLEVPLHWLEGAPTIDDIARRQEAAGHFGDDFSLVDAGVREPMRQALSDSHRQWPGAYTRETRRGRILEISAHALPGGGSVRTYTDVTEHHLARRALQDSEAQSRKLALAAAHTDSSMSISDRERRIEWVNAGFTRLTGYTLDEVRGRNPGHMLRGPASDRGEAERIEAQLARGERVSAELINYAKDGRQYWVAIEIDVIHDAQGEVTHFIANDRDITERKAAEQALIAARDEADRANRAKSEFLSRMSHELRTPLNAILGFSQLLETDTAHVLASRQADHLREITRGGRHLLVLISDVLDLSRVEAGALALSLEPVAVADTVADCLRMVAPVAQARGIELAVSPGLAQDWHVIGDRTRLKQVLLNLLSNAIKYNRQGGQVGVDVSLQDDQVRIDVSDQGRGLTPAQQQKLFQAFERLGVEGSSIEGAGIGLALSMSLVTLMHGQLGVHSEPGHGSTFWLRLPRATAWAKVEPAAVESHTPTAPGREQTVLYIEDNPVNAVLMEAMLEHLPGLKLVTAPLPADGLEMAQRLQPELILLDIQLPGMDGFEVLRRLQLNPATRGLAVVAVSANAMQGDIERGMSAGFADYLTKPLDMGRLLLVVNRLLGRD